MFFSTCHSVFLTSKISQKAENRIKLDRQFPLFPNPNLPAPIHRYPNPPSENIFPPHTCQLTPALSNFPNPFSRIFPFCPSPTQIYFHSTIHLQIFFLLLSFRPLNLRSANTVLSPNFVVLSSSDRR